MTEEYMGSTNFSSTQRVSYTTCKWMKVDYVTIWSVYIVYMMSR